MKEENKEYLTTQIITYIGNKRQLIRNIEEEVKKIAGLLGKEKLARMLKKYSSVLIANDLEEYSRLINECYLTDKKDFPHEKWREYKSIIEEMCRSKKEPGIITKNYAPQDDGNIQRGERVFYTHENALLIDTYRSLIDKVVQEEDMKKFFLAPLVTEASVHVNTSGVFKGFYKDKNTGIGCFGAAG